VIGRQTIDVSGLPNIGFDHRSPLWWGNLLLLIIETVMFAIAGASYFYIRMNFEFWPPPRVDRLPVLYNTDPDLFFGSANTLLLGLSCLPMYWMDRAARHLRSGTVLMGLLVLILVGLSAMALRWFEFSAIHFDWADNAYASIVWTLLGTHLLHLLVATLEFSLLAHHTFCHGLDEKHALDVTVTAVYWYWVVGMWLLVYSLVYFGARIL
jgi:heme/copper-type cytochrome/quinol oxidase subunit 3